MKRENNGKMRIIPLGGLEKIGMNITAFEYEDSIIFPGGGYARNRPGHSGCHLPER